MKVVADIDTISEEQCVQDYLLANPALRNRQGYEPALRKAVHETYQARKGEQS